MIQKLEVQNPRIFGTRFWGFSPEDEPFVSFTHRGTRDKVRKTEPGSLILVLGTKTEKTQPEDRGRLLGLIEYSQEAVYTDDIISGVTLDKTDLFENGVFKWPFALTARRAWYLSDKPKIEDVIGRQLSMAAITDVDELSAAEVSEVLKLNRREASLPETVASRREKRFGNRSGKAVKASAGEYAFPPSQWSKYIARQDGPTDVYTMRYGETNIWKIGITQNLERRLEQMNFSVPSEFTNASWSIHWRQGYDDGATAFEMEQSILKSLSSVRTHHERVNCTQENLEKVWLGYLSGRN